MPCLCTKCGGPLTDCDMTVCAFCLVDILTENNYQIGDNEGSPSADD
jgi:hypothetical protein